MTAQDLFFDLETAPVQDERLIDYVKAELVEAHVAALAAVKPHGNIKDEAKKAADVEEKRAKLIADHDAKVREAYQETALDGGLGQIVCIGFAVGDAEPESIVASDLTARTEAQMLTAFYRRITPLGRKSIVGHNIVRFDIPFVWHRSIVRGIEPPAWFPRNVKPWEEERVYDTQAMWGGQKFPSLTRLCRILGIDVADDITGADVWSLVQAGDFAKVAAHCRADVEKVRDVYRRMTFARPVAVAGAA